jgi:hypothetical protein
MVHVEPTTGTTLHPVVVKGDDLQRERRRDLVTHEADRSSASGVMTRSGELPVGIKLHSDIERRPGVDGDAYRARVRWYDPTTRKRRATPDPRQISPGRVDPPSAWRQGLGHGPACKDSRRRADGDRDRYIEMQRR